MSVPNHVETSLMPVPSEPPAGMLSGNLWGTDNPDLMLRKASAVATALARVIEDRKMFTMIGQGKHVRVEGWQTLGAMVGVFPMTAWTRKLENGWEARVEARTRSGELVGAAEAQCLNDERNWASKEDHSLRSMAQTRAVSKALAMPLRFVIALAGFEGTPAEEMPTGATPADAAFSRSESKKRTVNQPAERPATPASSAPAASPPATDAALKDWTGLIERVTMKEGTNKNGKPYKLYTIYGAGAVEFKSFSESHGKDAHFGSEEGIPMTIRYRESTFRDKVNRDAQEVFPASEPEEPGAQG